MGDLEMGPAPVPEHLSSAPKPGAWTVVCWITIFSVILIGAPLLWWLIFNSIMGSDDAAAKEHQHGPVSSVLRSVAITREKGLNELLPSSRYGVLACGGLTAATYALDYFEIMSWYNSLAMIACACVAVALLAWFWIAAVVQVFVAGCCAI